MLCYVFLDRLSVVDLSFLTPVILLCESLLIAVASFLVLKFAARFRHPVAGAAILLVAIFDLIAGGLFISSGISYAFDGNIFGSAGIDFKMAMIAAVFTSFILLLTGVSGIWQLIKWKEGNNILR